MIKKIVYLIIVLLVVSVQSLIAQNTRVDSLLTDFNNHPEYILVAAHRAAHQQYPENSKNAILEAIRVRTDIVELDVRETKDHELVIIHDRTIDRTTNQTGSVIDFTLAELKEIPLLHNGEPTDQRILTLDEALKLAKDKIIVDIDFKAETKQAFFKALEIIESNAMEQQVLFYIYDDYKYIKKIRKLANNITVMPRAYSEKNIKKLVGLDVIEVIHIDFSFYNDALMQETINSGSRVWANALGKYDKMQVEQGNGYDAITQMKINIIQTDYPEELLIYLKAHGLHR
ncbi:glycerophosphodiester phosphodiesterase family protein [Neptunitalea lumnitzerae]|uniref:Glycerophosphoryl diester phosphodiesterase n=1 Tax=Neptunitalea lumnitzerae TaxID=2965509 RepID=A0ABQ5MIC9_9FLAO|nr:glycerophosphodiester phosphodiesterase family protein [Neptunitalea sp. Y10]GLB49170.1 glycerophosphoryl diester phosphodiesterase [Neptunitalea sp. Y10]